MAWCFTFLWGKWLQNLFFACGYLPSLSHIYSASHLGISTYLYLYIMYIWGQQLCLTIWRFHTSWVSLSSGHLYVILCELKHMTKTKSRKGKSWWGFYLCNRQTSLNCSLCGTVCASRPKMSEPVSRALVFCVSSVTLMFVKLTGGWWHLFKGWLWIYLPVRL